MILQWNRYVEFPQHLSPSPKSISLA